MNIIDCCMNGEDVWLNPVGGLGDMIIVSSVLKLVHERHPDIRFNVVKRHRFTPFFIGHPAVARLGHPPIGARTFGTLYWQDEEFFGEAFFASEIRPFQILAKKFGLATPVEERMFYPGKDVDVTVLVRHLPELPRVVMIAPCSDSPRKEMHPVKWVQLVNLLREEGVACVQVGRDQDPLIQGCISFLGLTSADQLYRLMPHVKAVVTSDNFVMHMARAAGRDAVVLWGATKAEMYGYADHVHVTSGGDCEERDVCIGKGSRYGYRDECDKPPEEKCMNCISIVDVARRVLEFVEA